VYNTNTKTIIYTSFKHIAELINENIWKNTQLLAKQPFAEILRRIGTLISPENKIVHLRSKTPNYSKELKTQLFSYLGPNATLVASEATSRSFKLATPIKPADLFIPPMDANEQRNAIRFNNQHHKIIDGKSGKKIRSNLKQTNPTRPWEPTNEYNNKASASLPRNKSATNKTKEFSIKLQTLSFFTREKMAKQTKKDLALVPQPHPPQPQQNKSNPTPKAITKAQWDHIHANQKTFLAKQKQIKNKNNLPRISIPQPANPTQPNPLFTCSASVQPPNLSPQSPATL
jgi:hypothetical protein